MKNRGRVTGALPLGDRTHSDRREYADIREYLGHGPLSGFDGPLVPRDALDVKVVTRLVAYACPAGHDLSLKLFAGVHVPQMWECIVHRQLAGLVDAGALVGAGAVIAELVDAQAKRTPKTHWEHVLARRTTHELEALFQERLDVLRAGRAAQPVAA